MDRVFLSVVISGGTNFTYRDNNKVNDGDPFALRLWKIDGVGITAYGVTEVDAIRRYVEIREILIASQV